MTRYLIFWFAALFLVIGQWSAWTWWTPLSVILVFALFRSKDTKRTFLQAFVAGLLVWGGFAAYYHFNNEGLLGERLANTFGLPSGWLLVLVTALWGALGAGLAGWAGASLRTVIGPAKAT